MVRIEQNEFKERRNRLQFLEPEKWDVIWSWVNQRNLEIGTCESNSDEKHEMGWHVYLLRGWEYHLGGRDVQVELAGKDAISAKGFGVHCSRRRRRSRCCRHCQISGELQQPTAAGEPNKKNFWSWTHARYPSKRRPAKSSKKHFFFLWGTFKDLAFIKNDSDWVWKKEKKLQAKLLDNLKL